MRRGQTVRWCAGGYTHDHDCGPHDPECDLEATPPMCVCTRCGHEQLSGKIVDKGEMATLGEDVPNVKTIVVDCGPLPITLPETAVQ